MEKNQDTEESTIDKKIEIETDEISYGVKTDKKIVVSVKLSTLIKNYDMIAEIYKKRVRETLTDLSKDNVNIKIDGLYLLNFISRTNPGYSDFIKLFKLSLRLGFAYETDSDFIKYVIDRLDTVTEFDKKEEIEQHTRNNKWLQPTLDKDINLQVKLAAAIVNSTCLRFNNLGEKAFIPKYEKDNQQKDEEDEKVKDEGDNTDTKKQKLEEN